MKTYQKTFTDSHGEVWAVEHRFKSNWEFMGWDFYKNDNWCQFISDNEFSLNGANVTCKTDDEAIKIGIALERLDSESEVAFFKSHPELNP
jgi:hypothetical protein